MRSSKKLFVAIAAAGLVAAGGSAFTNSNTASETDTLGYSSTSVSGGVVNSVAYNLNAFGDNVNSVTLVLDTDTTTSAVSIGFNGGATTSCGTGAYDESATETSYTCDDGGANFSQLTAELASTAVVIN